MKPKEMRVRIRRTPADPSIAEYLGDVSVRVEGIHMRMEMGREWGDAELYFRLPELRQFIDELAAWLDSQEKGAHHEDPHDI